MVALKENSKQKNPSAKASSSPKKNSSKFSSPKQTIQYSENEDEYEIKFIRKYKNIMKNINTDKKLLKIWKPKVKAASQRLRQNLRVIYEGLNDDSDLSDLDLVGDELLNSSPTKKGN